MSITPASASASMQDQAAQLPQAVAVFRVDQAHAAPVSRPAAALSTPRPKATVRQPVRKQLASAKATSAEAEWEAF